MKRWLLMGISAALILLLVANGVLTRPVFNGTLEGDPMQGIEILPIEQGLTFARIVSGDAAKLVIVRRVSPEGLHVIDIGRFIGRPVEDPLVALTTNGFEEMDYVARSGVEQLVSFDTVTVPLLTDDVHIAVGTNYKTHAEETGIEDGPFLFPKLSDPTAWNAPVPKRGRMDYEAELCAVPLSSITADRDAQFGFVLCNDFTDRWTLVRDLEFDQPMGTTGFAQAKGGAGMMPLGPFFIVPRDEEAFYPEVELELFVDGRLRQKSKAGLMIWSPREIARKALSACEQDYVRGNEKLTLTSCEGIQAGTILLTGTPGGVLFHPATIWNPLAYLRSGDEVVLRARYLGALRNVIE